MYKQAAEHGDGSDAEAQPEAGTGETPGGQEKKEGGDDVIDAEFTEK